jgi:hypothetical protein
MGIRFTPAMKQEAGPENVRRLVNWYLLSCAFCQKWRENECVVLPIPPLPLSQTVGAAESCPLPETKTLRTRAHEELDDNESSGGCKAT